MDRPITCHMIGNAHLDPVWLWGWREGYQENKATVLSALDRLDEFDDFIFTSSSAQLYAWLEENEPEMFARVRERIREGRWVLCGGWWIQPDCNIPSGESFARQALLAQTYFREKFGVQAHVGYCVDSFGHNAMLPQLLKKSGMDAYVFMRPGKDEMELPEDLFTWRAPDGSEITAYRLPLHYGFCEQLEQKLDDCLALLPPERGSMMFFYGVGNHGGGPTVQNLREIHALQEKRTDVRLVLSSPDAFFRELPKNPLPVVTGDLHHHAAGCYALNSEIKRLNRRTENALLAAEKLQVLSQVWCGQEPLDGMEWAWKQLLFNQFHDTLAGTALQSSYDDARNQLGEALAIADRCENHAAQRISFRIGIPKEEGMVPVVVCNPHSWPVRTPVELETGLFPMLPCADALTVTDCEGVQTPHQIIQSASVAPNRVRVTFMAEVPALGYAVYHLRRTEQAASEEQGNGDAFALENGLLCAELDKTTGELCTMVDKRTGRQLLSAAASAVVYDDPTDTWGHTLKKIDHACGSFRLAAIRVLDDGPVRKCVQTVSRFGASALVRTYSLYAGEDLLRVTAKLNWQEHRRVLKLCFPLAIEQPQAVSEIPFGAGARRFDGLEETMQRWADVSGEGCGLSLLNDGKYSVSFLNGAVCMTAARSAIYAQHDPCEPEADMDYSYLDTGEQRFSYQLKLHAGDWRAARTVQDAALLNQPAFAMYETYHDGPIPQRAGAIEIEKENILLCALKLPYRGSGMIVRLRESRGERTQTALTLFGQTQTLRFDPFEVKTFRITPDGRWEETNLLEQVQSEETT